MGQGRQEGETTLRSEKIQRHFCPVSDATSPGELHPRALLVEQHGSESSCMQKGQLLPGSTPSGEAGWTTLPPVPCLWIGAIPPEKDRKAEKELSHSFALRRETNMSEETQENEAG